MVLRNARTKPKETFNYLLLSQNIGLQLVSLMHSRVAPLTNLLSRNLSENLADRAELVFLV